MSVVLFCNHICVKCPIERMPGCAEHCSRKLFYDELMNIKGPDPFDPPDEVDEAKVVAA